MTQPTSEEPATAAAGLRKLAMPNLRKLFIPDPGMTLFEIDLKGADARVVAWEAGDESLKAAFNSGLDVHSANARAIWPTASDAQIAGSFRQRAKTAVHAVNYGCKARTLMEHISCSLGEAEGFIRRWNLLHPQVFEWHRRIEQQLRSRSMVSNQWGYCMRYFDRPDNLLPKALAWIGQSTTAIACNKMLVSIARELPLAEILLQTHDSVTIQLPSNVALDFVPRLQELCSIQVPYPDPLVMPADIKISTESWGEMHAPWLPAETSATGSMPI